MVQETLAANLRRLRIARHLSLSELARATSMSKATLSSIENGRANPTVDTLYARPGSLLPLEDREIAPSKAYSSVTTMTRWNEPVRVQAPPHAIRVS